MTNKLKTIQISLNHQNRFIVQNTSSDSSFFGSSIDPEEVFHISVPSWAEGGRGHKAHVCNHNL